MKFTFQYGQIRNLQNLCLLQVFQLHLHSSMVRLETINSVLIKLYSLKIYIPVWLDQKRYADYRIQRTYSNLHSSMVRLETIWQGLLYLLLCIFTFQYGQIRNVSINKVVTPAETIYIPVWLDQKHLNRWHFRAYFSDLHSSMVRLET